MHRQGSRAIVSLCCRSSRHIPHSPASLLSISLDYQLIIEEYEEYGVRWKKCIGQDYVGRGLKLPSLFFLVNLYIYLFLPALGLCCCTRAFSSCGERGLLFVGGEQASHCGGFSCCGTRALGARASVVVAHGLSSCGSRPLERRRSSCGARA